MSKEILFLDAQTRDTDSRITAFGDGIAEITKEFLNWVKENELTPKDLWYADIFEHVDGQNEHIASITLLEDGGCEIKAPTKKVKNPYKRRKGLFRK